MAAKDRSACFELAFEGERLCKAGDYITGVQYFEEAVDLGTDDLSILSAIYSQLGNAYIVLRDFVKAVQYHQHDRTLARTIGDLSGEAKASSNLSNALKMVGKYDEAIVCCQTHLDICRETLNKSGEAKALYNMGNLYHMKGKLKCTVTSGLGKQDPDAVSDLNVAVRFYNKNLAIVKELGDRASLGKVCGSLGNTYYLLGNCSEAVKYHTERLAIAKEFGDKAAQRRAYTNLGNTHVLLGEYQLAAEYYLHTLSISRQLRDQAIEAQACYSLGSTYTLLGDFKRAIEYHMRHKQIAEALNDRVGIARACWLLSNAHMSLNNYKKALEYSKQQLQFSTEIGDEAGMSTAEKKVQDLEALVGEGQLPSGRVRRLSMENMKLLRFTPEQAKDSSTSGKKNTGKSRELFPKRLEDDRINGNDVDQVVDSQPSRNNVKNTLPNCNAPLCGTPDHDDTFFDLLTRLQGRRLNDQRAEMRGDDDLEVPDFLRANDDRANNRDGFGAWNEQESAEHHERMNSMISMLARSQSKRLDEQRVSLSSLPGVRITPSSLNSLPMAALPAGDVGNHDAASRNMINDDDDIHLTLDDHFLDNLMRCQGTRLNDQRSAAPSGEPYPTPTIPDEDFISLIIRMQSSRIDDQRCAFEPGNP